MTVSKHRASTKLAVSFVLSGPRISPGWFPYVHFQWRKVLEVHFGNQPPLRTSLDSALFLMVALGVPAFQ
ncbi:unannotated protein [freshwater metagenome]|uniref:Unannotated protein n=1 Tax=freshwater metagenome TaxID=449393 RepID=A0A6J6VV36_9ZZZZ